MSDFEDALTKQPSSRCPVTSIHGYAGEAKMRRTIATAHAQRALPLPRGWIVAGLALASWGLFAGLWAGMSQLFALVLAAV